MLGLGRVTTRDYDVGSFTAIRAAGLDVEIIQSGTFSVTVRANEDVIDRIVVRKSGDTLVLNAKRRFWRIGPLTLEATVTMRSLTALTLSHAATLSIDDFRDVSSLAVDLNGASEVRGRIEARGIELLAVGASRVKLSGSAGRIAIEGSGASSFDLRRLRSERASVDLSGASHASLDVAAIDSIVVSGGSHLRYSGDPALGSIQSSGASHLTRV